MIPKRRPQIRRVEEMEIRDEDIVEIKPKPGSGTYAAVKHPPPAPAPSVPTLPPVPTSSDPIVRYSLDSVTDDLDVHIDTALNDVNIALARLSMEDKSASELRLRGAVEWTDLSPEEAWVVSLVMAGFDLQAMIASSPRSEEDTLTLLGRLINMRLITLVPSKKA